MGIGCGRLRKPCPSVIISITSELPILPLAVGADLCPLPLLSQPPRVDPLLVRAKAVLNTTSENKDHDTALSVRVTDKASIKDVAWVAGTAPSSGDSTEYKSNTKATVPLNHNTTRHKSG
jgi:hypothetical protein